MGIGCTWPLERIGAAFGDLNGVQPVFQGGADVKAAGVLFALPSLLINGLLNYGSGGFSLPKGYYRLNSIFLILAFMALLRIKTPEGIRYWDPGELGKLIGMDRIPEVRTLRGKIDYITTKGDPKGWSAELAKSWMDKDKDLIGTLYVDGHVRVYHGKKTPLPKRYVAREKLCLRGMTDYWVNDALGRPIFVVHEALNSGLLKVLRKEIVPRLIKELPGQPSEKELEANPSLYRFGIVTDREGYSPVFFSEMWQMRIACYTYRKYAGEDWREEEFQPYKLTFPNGEVSTMKLSERGVYLKRGKIWIREIRKLTDTGHQTAIVTTDYISDLCQIAVNMFSRWSQENFFKYMMEHFGMDRLIEYEVEKIDDTARVRNPEYRELEGKIRSQNGKLSRKKIEFSELILKGEIEEKEVQDFVRRKSELQEAIGELDKEITELKAKKKETDSHILFKDLPAGEKFKGLASEKKHFMDTIKMIAYRAETAMVSVLRSFMLKKDEARGLVRQIFQTDADLIPDEKNRILKVRLHNLTNPRNNRYVQKICEVLNESETVFPDTNLRLVYDSVSNHNPADQEF